MAEKRDPVGSLIRDFRIQKTYSIDKEFIEKGWAALLQPYPVAVYNCLCCHANTKTGRAFPSYQTIANETGMSRRKAIDAVQRLLDFRLIFLQESEKDNPNTCFLLDKSEWIVPDGFEGKVIRSDKGKPNKKRSRPKKSSGEYYSPPVVNNKARSGEYHSPPVVNNKARSGEYHSPKQEYNNKNKENKNHQQQKACLKKEIQESFGDGVDDINFIFSENQRKERITTGQIKKIIKEHELKSGGEILKAVKYLSHQQFYFAGSPISNVIGFLIGTVNGGGRSSSCFVCGECLFPEPIQETFPEETISKETIPEIPWEQTFSELSEKEQALIRGRAASRVATHKANMPPEVYADTLNLAVCTVFQEWSQEQAQEVR